VGVVADNEDEMISYWLFGIFVELGILNYVLCYIASLLEKKSK
jgi:hypothetical protein